MGEECSFSFISFLDSDVVVAPTDIYDCKFGASAEAVYHLVNEGGYVSVLFGPFIDGLVVLDWS